MKNSTKKVISIIIINLFVALILYIIAEFICMYLIYKSLGHTNFSYPFHVKCNISNLIKNKYIDYKDLRPVSYPKIKTGKGDVILLGCSFTYGLGLKENETFSAKLAELSGRTVYNLGITAGGPREMLYLLQNDNLRNTYLKNADNTEYVFYLFIPDHINRLYITLRLYTASPYFNKTKDNHLEYKPVNRFINHSSIYQCWERARYSNININNEFDNFKIYISEINREVKKHYPNAKFVILIFSNPNNFDFSSLESKGIRTVDLSELSNIQIGAPEFRISETDAHPNEKVWNVAVPDLIKKLNL